MGKIVAEADAGMTARVTDAATKVVPSLGTKISEAMSVAHEVPGGTNITQEERDRLYDKFGEIGKDLPSEVATCMMDNLREEDGINRRRIQAMRKHLRALFGTKSEKLRLSDEELDACVADLPHAGRPRGHRRGAQEGGGELPVLQGDQGEKRLAEMAEGKDPKPRKVGRREDIPVSKLPPKGPATIIYPDEYLDNPGEYTVIRSETQKEIVPALHPYMVRTREYPVVVRKGDPDAKPLQAPRVLAPIGRSYASPELLASIEIAKFDDHIPLYRQEEQFARVGLGYINRQLMDGWHSQVSGLLSPLYDAMITDLMTRSDTLCGDGVPANVIDPQAHKARKYYVAAIISPVNLLALFWKSTRRDENDPTKYAGRGRGKEDIRLALEQWKPRDGRGAVLHDAYTGWNEHVAEKGAENYLCNAHARRYIGQSADESPKEALEGLSFYAVLSGMKSEIEDQGYSNTRKTAERRRERPIWKAFLAWAADILKTADPNSSIYRAAKYLTDHAKGLKAYLKNPEVPFTNNISERAVKNVVMGCKNYLFFQSVESARDACMFYTFIEPAKMHGVDPKEWLTYVLTNIRRIPKKDLWRALPQYWDQRIIF